MTERIRFFGDSISGNCYKLQMASAELGIAYDWVETSVMDGSTRTPEFLAMNPNGKVPVMQLSDGRYLAESNAILSFLADGSPLAGGDRYERANVLRWMNFEQYSHEPYIATSRFIIKYLGGPPERQAELEAKKAGGYGALDVMERQLAEAAWIANGAYSIADIALYAYTHVAHEGGFSLQDYPGVRAWLERIEAGERYVPMRSNGHD
ncbi:MAG: glutathione S-transferase family protein [Woeseiaceae bacterium]|nr:glutathione S-transferase family protein [Woeseiaceae bacterium]